MDTIPEELLERWAERERLNALPEIPVIDLVDHEPSPPALDFLDESSDDLSKTVTKRFLGGESSEKTSPWIDPLKLHGTQSVAPGTISIATYAPKKLPKTDRHA